MIITEEGEVVPRGDTERLAAERETGQVEETEVVEDAPALGDMATDLVEDVQEEATVQVHRAPREQPTREERMRHEATHLPCRSWCPTCVRGSGRNAPAQRSGGT